MGKIRLHNQNKRNRKKLGFGKGKNRGIKNCKENISLAELTDLGNVKHDM